MWWWVEVSSSSHLESGWQDSNLRPLAPKASALTKLRYTPLYYSDAAKAQAQASAATPHPIPAAAFPAAKQITQVNTATTRLKIQRILAVSSSIIFVFYILKGLYFELDSPQEFIVCSNYTIADTNYCLSMLTYSFCQECLYLFHVGAVGLEPTLLTERAPKARGSANSPTPPYFTTSKDQDP